MHIKHEGGDSGGKYSALIDDREIGFMTYSRAGDQLIIIDHTDVNEEYKGKGVGLKLVTAAVENAREDGFNIIPLCPFAKSVFDKDAGLRDVLK